MSTFPLCGTGKRPNPSIAIPSHISPPPRRAGCWPVYAKNDPLMDVRNARANISPASVSAPLYVMTDVQQADFNVGLNGQAINIIPGETYRGNVVGARARWTATVTTTITYRCAGPCAGGSLGRYDG
jgi:hypothetical protein